MVQDRTSIQSDPEDLPLIRWILKDTLLDRRMWIQLDSGFAARVSGENISGWWCNVPILKNDGSWVRQWEGSHPFLMKWNMFHSCLKPPSHIYGGFSHGFPMGNLKPPSSSPSWAVGYQSPLISSLRRHFKFCWVPDNVSTTSASLFPTPSSPSLSAIDGIHAIDIDRIMNVAIMLYDLYRKHSVTLPRKVEVRSAQLWVPNDTVVVFCGTVDCPMSVLTPKSGTWNPFQDLKESSDPWWFCVIKMAMDSWGKPVNPIRDHNLTRAGSSMFILHWRQKKSNYKWRVVSNRLVHFFHNAPTWNNP